jgi:two-component system NtrC family response regulator
MVMRGDFRQDLLYRIQTIHIQLPPLREREGDIKELTDFHLSRLSAHYGVPPKVAGADFYEVLNNYNWPGNVRQLFNIVEQAFVAAGTGNTIYAMHLSDDLRIKIAKSNLQKKGKLESASKSRSQSTQDEFTKHEEQRRADSAVSSAVSNLLNEDMPSLKEFKGLAEKRYLEELQFRYSGDVAKILKVSGLSRSHFYALLKKHNLKD